MEIHVERNDFGAQPSRQMLCIVSVWLYVKVFNLMDTGGHAACSVYSRVSLEFLETNQVAVEDGVQRRLQTSSQELGL